MKLKKLTRAVALIVLAVSTAANSLPVFAAGETAEDVLNTSVVMKIGSSTAYVNNAAKTIDENPSVKPELKNDRTFVPVRFISENFDADVSYDTENETVTVTLGDNNASIKIGSKEMMVNGEQTELDAEPYIYEERTFVPLRAITEAIGKKVFWYNKGLIVIGDRDSISDDNAEKLMELFATNIEAADITEVEADNYFSGGVGIKQTYAAGVLRPDECTIEMTVQPDRAIDSLRQLLSYPFLVRYNKKNNSGTQILMCSYPFLHEFVGQYDTTKTGMRFSCYNGKDTKNTFVAADFANYKVGEKLNIAFTWKKNDKMAFWMNGQPAGSIPIEDTFPEELMSYCALFSTEHRFGTSQIKVSSKALDSSSLSSDPSIPFEADSNTTMILNDNMQNTRYYTSDWHRESNYARITPAFRSDKQIFYPTDKVVFPIMGLNKTLAEKNYTVKLTAVNSDGNTLIDRDIPINVPGDDKYHIYEISLPELTGNIGHYSIHTDMYDGETLLDSLDSAISVFPSDDTSIEDGEMASYYGNEFVIDEPFSTYSKSNASITRLQRTFHWCDLEPAQGQWDFSFPDKYVEECKKNNIEILAVLGKTPYWATDAKWGPEEGPKTPQATVPRSMDEWYNYVYTVVSRYKDYIKVWEVWNEIDHMPPNSYASWNGTQEQYIELLGVAYKAIKAADPSATVSTSGFGNLDKDSIGYQIATTLMKDEYKTGYYDIFNAHGYGSADKFDAFFDELNAKRPGTTVWMGEEMPMGVTAEDQKAFSMVNKYVTYIVRGFSKFIQMSSDDLFVNSRTRSPSYAYQCGAALQQLIRKCNGFEQKCDNFTNAQYLALRHSFKRTDGKYLTILGSDATKGTVYIKNSNITAYDDVGREIEPVSKDGLTGVYVNLVSYIISDELPEIDRFESGGSKNFIANGGFENVGGDLAFDDLYPISWTEVVDESAGGDINIKKEGNGGEYALYLKSANGTDTGVTQQILLKDAGKYTVNLSAKQINGDKSARLAVTLKDVKTGATKTAEVKNITSDYKEYALEFELKDKPESGVEIQIFSVGDAEMLVDDVSINLAENADEFANNIITNYSFTDGLSKFTQTNQTATGKIGITENGITGRSVTVSADGTGKIYVIASTSATAAGRYKFSARFKRVSGRSVLPYVGIFNVDANAITEATATDLYGYKYVTVTTYMDFTAPANNVKCYAGIKSGSGEIMLDDVCFELVTD